MFYVSEKSYIHIYILQRQHPKVERTLSWKTKILGVGVSSSAA